jgi:hypothetical protein
LTHHQHKHKIYIVKKSESSTVQDIQEQQVISSKESEQIKNNHINSSSTQTLDIVKISGSSTAQDLQEQQVISFKESEQIKKYSH